MSDDETVSLSIDKAGAPRFYFIVVPGCKILYDNEVLALKITTRCANKFKHLEREMRDLHPQPVQINNSFRLRVMFFVCFNSVAY